MTNISDMKDDSQIQIQNKSANESDFDLEKESNSRDDVDDKNLRKKHSKKEGKTSFKVLE